MRTVLVSHVTQYAGPGVVATLLRQGCRVIAHDPSFAEASARARHAAEHPGVECLAAQHPEAIVAELAAREDWPHAVVCNDVHPNTPRPFDEIDPAEACRSFEALYLFPLALAQGLVPAMRARGSGSIVFVTSARALRPEPGFALATSVRAATTTLALAVAREVAADGIQVNVVAPNYLYSEMYYPRAVYIDSPVGRAEIAQRVPLGRLGTPEELGELVSFLVSGRCGFVTGQVIPFTGGWP